MLVTPWLALGAGFVLAAAAVIFAPHAQLQFGRAIGVTRCPSGGCGTAPGAGGTAVPAGAGDTPLAGPAPSPAAPAGRSAGQAPAAPPASAAGVAVSYDMLFGGRSGFEMLITVRGQRQPGPWQLAFAIPGSGNLSVTGARWSPAGPAAGTAGGTLPPAGQHRTQFVVQGTGRPAAPSQCVYNGSTCRFIEG